MTEDNQNLPKSTYQEDFDKFSKQQRTSNRQQAAQIKALTTALETQKKLVGFALVLGMMAISLQIFSKEKPMPPEVQSIIQSVAIACILGSGTALVGAGGVTTHPPDKSEEEDEENS